MLNRLAANCYRARRMVVAVWAAALIALVVLAGLAPGRTNNQYTVPGSGSQQASQLLREHGLSDDQAGSMRIVFQDHAGLDAPPVRAALNATLTRLRDRLPGARVTPPFTSVGRAQVSPDRTVAYAQVQLRGRDGSELSGTQLADVPGEIEGIAPPVPGLHTAFAGPMFESASGGGPGEGIGILAAAVILFVAFGSVLAMGLPLLVALFGAGCGVVAVILVANVVDMSSAAVPLAAMLAVGVGIDYSLLVVTRYREALAGGLAPQEAVPRAHQTAGRAVIFAGITVVVAVLGLLVINMPLINGVALGSALAIVVTMTASLTLLPALLGFVGAKIDRFGLPHRGRAAGGHGTFARRWSRSVQRRPWQYAIGSLMILGVLTAPVSGMRLGFPDDSTLSVGNTARQAYAMLSSGFGPGANGPLFAVVNAGQPATVDAALAGLRQRLAVTPGVAKIGDPVVSSDGQLGMLAITPATGPSAAPTASLARQLRDHTIPGTVGTVSRTARGYLTGSTAAALDFSDYTAAWLPAFLAVIMAVAFLLLLLVFRSLLVPVKAVVVNLLSIGAAFGVVVAAVQWGWGSALFGLAKPIPVVAWVPMMMVAVVFGLSMDYEVFLLSRIKEHHDAGRPNDEAVASGLASTARVITAAAAIMVCVFASFMLGGAVDLAQFGFGLAVAVLIDATLVRMVLVPAAMQLLGERNWWLPRGLARRLPELGADAPAREHVTAARPAGNEL